MREGDPTGLDLREPSLLHKPRLLLDPERPRAKVRGLARMVRVLAVEDDQTPARLQYAQDLREPPTLQAIGQVVHHPGTEHRVERLVGEGQVLDKGYLEIDGQAPPRSLGAGAGDLLGRSVDPDDAP